MPGRTDPPDWLDELYQAQRNELPPPELDARIRAEARKARTPWYRQPARLATAATLLLAAGVATIWLGNLQLEQAGSADVTVISNPVTVTDEIIVTPRRQAQMPAPSMPSAPAPTPSAPAALKDTDIATNAARSETRFSAEKSALSERPAESAGALATDLSDTLERTDATAAGEAIPGVAEAEESAVGIAQSAARLTAAEPKSETADAPVGRLSCRQLSSADTDTSYQLCELNRKLSVRHADCEADFPLPIGGSVTPAPGDALRLRTDGKDSLLRCTQDQWQLTDLPPATR